jgi:subfamily B ATP-binding cassette protein MsbA
VLHDISFSVKQGEHIAIVGKSGAGKSTLVSLMLRLYDAEQGAIRVNGHDIRAITLESLRKQIGLVTQEAFLFNDTLADNIAAKQNGSKSQAVEKAAKAAYADIFIENLSQKYDTLYGVGGIDLSGGQKHRIALARAIFKESTILILDEAMANLDSESENYILQALEKFAQGRTTFIIAHRFSTIHKVDRILVLDEGRFNGLGTHEELLKISDVYRSLYEKQMFVAK